MKRNVCFLGDKYALILLALFFCQSSYSQLSLKYGILEAGFTFAPSNLLGDLGGNAGRGGALLKDNNISNTKLLVGGHLSMFPTEWGGIRMAVNYGTISGDDALIKGEGGEEEGRKARNLNFKSTIYEAFIAAEFYPTVFLEYDETDRYHKVRPYLVVGVGIFHFNPKGLDPLTNKWVSLRPLHTEGEGFAEYPDRKLYNKNQLNIPIGVGLKYFFSDNLSISAEMLLRKTFTDYLDDVSTTYIDNNLFYKNLPLAKAVVAERMSDKSVSSSNRNSGEVRGKSSNMDAYYSAGIKLSYLLRSIDRRNIISCPVIRN